MRLAIKKHWLSFALLTGIAGIACAVAVYILSQQETSYLLWTGGITAVATLYWVLYLRPRRDTRWLVSIPEDAEA